MEIMISRTGQQHGAGSDPYKWVSGLTPEERVAAKSGSALVVVTDSPACRDRRLTRSELATVRVVLYKRGHYVPRCVPAEYEQAVIALLN